MGLGLGSMRVLSRARVGKQCAVVSAVMIYGRSRLVALIPMSQPPRQQQLQQQQPQMAERLPEQCSCLSRRVTLMDHCESALLRQRAVSFE